MVELFRSPRRLLLFLFEGALAAVLLLVASSVRFGLDDGLAYAHIAKKALLVSLVLQGSLYYVGFYDLSQTRQARQAFTKVLQGLLLTSLLLLPVFYLAEEFFKIGRGLYLAWCAMVAVVTPLWRVLYNRVTSGAGFMRRTLIVGNGPLAQELAQMIQAQPNLGLELSGMLARDQAQVSLSDGVIGIYRELLEIVTNEEIELVLVAFPDRRGNLPVDQLLEAKFRGVEVQEGIDFYEREKGKIYVRELKPSQLIFSEGFTARPTTRRLKRIIDVMCAGIGLVLAGPIMLLTMLLIRLESPGPVLYKQVRAGEFGKLFTILKFRSMRLDAEARGAQFAQKDDPRVTRVGRFIRKTRIDELPQLWNVLRGDMSMVGPRPERPVFIEQLEQQVPFFKQRLYVKPGVTGHAQVRCEYGASAEDMLEKLQYDLYYIKSYSVLFDLSIMADTVKVVLFRIGAR